MKETDFVSQLTLERYHLGEVTPEEHEQLEAMLAEDGELHSRYAKLQEEDSELRGLYPLESLNVLAKLQNTAYAEPETRRSTIRQWNRFGSAAGQSRMRTGKILGGLSAAAVFLCVFFLSLSFIRGRNTAAIAGLPESGTDRIKGTAPGYELSLYLKETPAALLTGTDEGRRLPDKTALSEGNTVQLAYTTPPGDVYYGVIFSIDGRSELTLHYPYRMEQNPVLSAGKLTFLNEAYTLDDAPDFEIFFMVASPTPLDIETVLKTAGELARDPETALAKSAAAFTGCDVETITIEKQGVKK